MHGFPSSSSYASVCSHVSPFRRAFHEVLPKPRPILPNHKTPATPCYNRKLRWSRDEHYSSVIVKQDCTVAVVNTGLDCGVGIEVNGVRFGALLGELHALGQVALTL